MTAVKELLKHKIIEPFSYNCAIKDSYQGYSVTGGTLRGKTVMITGATGDIGRALVFRFLKEECYVIAAGRDADKMQALVVDVEKNNAYRGRIDRVIIDLTDSNLTMSNVSNLLLRQKIDILVNNAGLLKKKDRNGNFRDVSNEELLLSWNTNVAGVIRLTETILEKTKCSNVVNISSICSHQRKMQYTIYGITKSIINEYTRCLATKYPDRHFAAILPGSVITKMGGLKVGDSVAVDCNKLHRPALPEEIASIAALLSSDIGNYVVNGSLITASACEVL